MAGQRFQSAACRSLLSKGFIGRNIRDNSSLVSGIARWNQLIESADLDVYDNRTDDWF